jgi:hypothetical protein
VFLGGDNLAPESTSDVLDQAGALLQGSAAIAGRGKLLLDAGRLFRVQLPQFAAQ